jgi:hypothetical protein
VIHETVGKHDLVLVVARPRDRSSIVAQRISDTLPAVTVGLGALDLEEVLISAISASVVVEGGQRSTAGEGGDGAWVSDSDRGHKDSELQNELEEHLAVCSACRWWVECRGCVESGRREGWAGYK